MTGLGRGRRRRPAVRVVASTLPAQAQAAVASAKSSAVETKFARGWVRVERSPFRIKLRTKSRRTLLSSLAGDSRSGSIDYSGLGFTVGAVPELEPPSFDPPPPGEPVAGESFAAKRVVSVRRDGRALNFVLRTDDPEGRRIILDVRRGRAGTARIRAEVRPAAGVSSVFAGFRAPKGESYHGFGGRREGTDLRGSDIRSWVFDYRYPDVSDSYYAPVTGLRLVARLRRPAEERPDQPLADGLGPRFRLAGEPAGQQSFDAARGRRREAGDGLDQQHRRSSPAAAKLEHGADAVARDRRDRRPGRRLPAEGRGRHRPPRAGRPAGLFLRIRRLGAAAASSSCWTRSRGCARSASGRCSTCAHSSPTTAPTPRPQVPTTKRSPGDWWRPTGKAILTCSRPPSRGRRPR